MGCMKNLLSTLEPVLAKLPVTASIQLASGERIGPEHSAVQLIFRSPKALAALLEGQVGSVGSAVVEGWVDIHGKPRDIMAAAAVLLQGDPVQHRPTWLEQTVSKAKSLAMHTLSRDAEQIQFHYDLSDDFYALWLDPRRVYSCAYYKDQSMNLAQAQEAKLDHICKKLRLQPGERFGDIGSGWGGLILWAAEHYGVQAHGITLSRNQFDHVQKLIAGKGLQDRVKVELRDYRSMDDVEPFDKIGSVGMFEHVGHKNYRAYFDMARRCLRDDGLFLLHTIGKNRAGAGIDPWIEKYIFPNGVLPSASEIAFYSEDQFVMEDWHNFGEDYDKTLMAWYSRFEAAWPALKDRYGERFYRMWRYYLLCCAATFRARDNQLWQVVLSPGGQTGGYRRPLM